MKLALLLAAITPYHNQIPRNCHSTSHGVECCEVNDLLCIGFGGEPSDVPGGRMYPVIDISIPIDLPYDRVCKVEQICVGMCTEDGDHFCAFMIDDLRPRD